MNFEDLVFLFTCGKENRGIIRMNFDEAALLWSSVKSSSGRILEIGCRNGGSLLLMHAAVPDREIVSVDVNFQIFKSVFGLLDFGRVSLLEQSSHVPVSGPFGFVFVDGDHSWDGVRGDVLTHWNFVAGVDPLVCFHDVSDRPGSGPARVVEILLERGVAEVVSRVGSLVVLRKVLDLTPLCRVELGEL